MKKLLILAVLFTPLISSAQYYAQTQEEDSFPWVMTILFSVGAIFTWAVFLRPTWSVWASKKEGEASLEQANFEEQIQIAKARARLNAAEMNKKAEIVEAEAVANSIGTIGDALRKNEGYLRWQWIKMMDRTENATIYVPTEANLPILEAMRLGKEKTVEVEEEV